MIGHRVCGPRWSVLPDDPAIDQDKSDFEKYAESLFDFDAGHVVIKDGETPTLFQQAPVEMKQRRLLIAMSDDDRSCMVVRCGLWAVKNWQAEGYEFKQPDRKECGQWGMCSSEEWLDSTGFHLADINTLAAMIWGISEPRPLSGKQSSTQPGDTG